MIYEEKGFKSLAYSFFAEDTIEDLSSKGNDEFKKSNFKGATHCFSQAIHKALTSDVCGSALSALYDARAECYLKQGNINKAKEDASESISRNKNGYMVSGRGIMAKIKPITHRRLRQDVCKLCMSLVLTKQ